MKEFELSKALWGLVNMGLGGLCFYVYVILGYQFYTSPGIDPNSEFIVIPLLTTLAFFGVCLIFGGANRIHEARIMDAEIGSLTVKEYIELMEAKGFHLTQEEEKDG